MAIRLATSGDLTTYASYAALAYRPMTVNDLIIDAHESASTNQVFIDLPSEFPSFRAGGNIWIKADATGEPYWGLKLTGNGTQWGGGAPVHFKPLTNGDGPVEIKKDRRNTNSYLIEIEDCEYVWWDGVDETQDIWGHVKANFNGLNSYGFEIGKDEAKHSTNLLAIKGKVNGIVIRNCKFSGGGFGKIRILPDDLDDAGTGTRVLEYTVVTHNYVIDDGGNGEAAYILTTDAGNATVSSKKYVLRDNYGMFAGAEAFQLQDLHYDSTFTNIVEHNQFYASAQDGLNPFLAAQASGVQTRMIGDNFKAWKNIFDGGLNNTWNFQSNSSHDNAAFDAGRKVDVRLNYFGRGGNRAFFFNSGALTTRLRIAQNFFDGMTNTYSRYSANSGAEVNTLIELAAPQTTEITDNQYENSRTLITGSDVGDLDNVEQKNNSAATIAAPSYIDIGDIPSPELCWNFHWFQGIDDTTNNVLQNEVVALGWFPRVATVDTGTNIFTLSTDLVSERFVDNDRLLFNIQQSGGTLPTGVSGGTLYYVISASGNTFKISETEGGAEVNITGTGVADWHIIKINDSNYGKRYRALNTVAILAETNWPPYDTTNFIEVTDLPMNFNLSDSALTKLGVGGLSIQTPRTVYDWYRADNAAMTTNLRWVRRTFEPTLNTVEPEIETGYYYSCRPRAGYNGTEVTLPTGILVS